MTRRSDILEQQRIALQAELDCQKDAGRAKPPRPVCDANSACPRYPASTRLRLFPPDEQVRFLDPAIGTGSFYSALLQKCSRRIGLPRPSVSRSTRTTVRQQRVSGKITGFTMKLADFTQAKPSAPFQSRHLQSALCPASSSAERRQDPPAAPDPAGERDQDQRPCRALLSFSSVSPTHG